MAFFILFVEDCVEILPRKPNNKFYMDDLTFCSLSPDPSIAVKTAQKAIDHLEDKNDPLYGASQLVPQNVNPPLAQIYHQASHINFSSLFLPH